MSNISWHNYGYGICTDHITAQDVRRLEKLLELAPEYYDGIKQWLKESEIAAPTWDDYMNYDQDCYLGLASILKGVIWEAEGISLLACDSDRGDCYLIYAPSYPWEITDRVRDLTEEKLVELFSKYVCMITDEEISIEYQEVENGG